MWKNINEFANKQKRTILFLFPCTQNGQKLTLSHHHRPSVRPSHIYTHFTFAGRVVACLILCRRTSRVVPPPFHINFPRRVSSSSLVVLCGPRDNDRPTGPVPFFPFITNCLRLRISTVVGATENLFTIPLTGSKNFR